MQEKILRDIRFQASVHGAEIKGEPSTTPKQSVEPTIPLFGAPEDYSHLSAEEKQLQTEKMMGRHKAWSQDPLNAKKQTQGL